MASPSRDDSQLPSGPLQPSTGRGEFNATTFLVAQALGKMQTATLVRVVACSNSGGLSPVGSVDVQPLVNQVDSLGNPTPHGTVYNLPYFRIQGGTNGIILDPEPGDIGVCVFASRDLSKVKATRAQANPGSHRQYSFSDGIYLGGVLNGMPSQYVRFSAAGIAIVSPVAVTLDAPVVNISAATSCTITTPVFTVNGATALNGPLTQGVGSAGGACDMLGPVNVAGDVVAAGVSVAGHHHTGVVPGSGTSGGPA